VRERLRPERLLLALAAPALAVAIAAVVSTLVLLASGHGPLHVYRSMWDFGTQTNSIISMVDRAVPYYLAGLAVAVGFKMNLFNIGVEGQYYLAVVVAAILAPELHLWAPLDVTIICAAAMATGAVWAGIAGVLKATRGVNEVISTIMLNNVVLLGFGAWLVDQYRAQDAGLQVATRPIPAAGRLPDLNRWLEHLGVTVPPGAHLTSFVLVAAAVGVAYYVILFRTRLGFDLRASGLNPWAAASSGVDPKGMAVKVMLLSGAIAGLAGLSFLLGDVGRYTTDFPTGLGFTGIAVALLGRNHPVGVGLAALLWGFMERSAQTLDLQGIPKEIVTIMQGTIVLSVVVAYEIVRRVQLARQQQEVSLQVDDERVAEALA
jgi:simple sugar transport system permease protein